MPQGIGSCWVALGWQCGHTFEGPPGCHAGLSVEKEEGPEGEQLRGLPHPSVAGTLDSSVGPRWMGLHSQDSGV